MLPCIAVSPAAGGLMPDLPNRIGSGGPDSEPGDGMGRTGRSSFGGKTMLLLSVGDDSSLIRGGNTPPPGGSELSGPVMPGGCHAPFDRSLETGGGANSSRLLLKPLGGLPVTPNGCVTDELLADEAEPVGCDPVAEPPGRTSMLLLPSMPNKAGGGGKFRKPSGRNSLLYPPLDDGIDDEPKPFCGGNTDDPLSALVL